MILRVYRVFKLIINSYIMISDKNLYGFAIKYSQKKKAPVI